MEAVTTGRRAPPGMAPGAAPWAVAVLAAVAACEAGADGGSGVTVRDSAGLRIVESPTPAWVEGEAWTVASRPLLEIGSAEGDPAHLFENVRGIARLSDGRLAVLEGGARELRLFDSNGGHLVSAGGPGEGPGEFRSTTGLWAVQGDTLAVWDASLRRLTFVAPDGSFGRFVTLEPLRETLRPDVHGFFADGSFLASSEASLDGGAAAREGLRRDSAVYLRLSTAGSVRDTLASLPGRQYQLRTTERAVMMVDLFFGRQTYAAARAGRLVAGDNDRLEVRLYTPDGALVGLARAAHEPEPVTEAHLLRAWEERLRDYPPGLRERVEEQLRTEGPSGPHAETLPAFTGLLLDPDGNVWLKRSALPEPGGERWSVLDPEGRWLGDVRMPAGLGVLGVGSSVVLGLRRDELGVERVAVHEILEP